MRNEERVVHASPTNMDETRWGQGEGGAWGQLVGVHNVMAVEERREEGGGRREEGGGRREEGGGRRYGDKEGGGMVCKVSMN